MPERRDNGYGLTKVWIHAIWSTREHQPILRETIRPQIIKHLYGAFQDQECLVRIVNGMEEHLHALFQLTPGISLASVMRLVMETSSVWINRQGLMRSEFRWQRGYGGFSVSGSMVGKVENYIRNQEVHHRRLTFHDEYEQFLDRYGVLTVKLRCSPRKDIKK